MTLADRLEQQGLEKGIDIGKQQGIDIGRLQGELTILKLLLTQRFGALSANQIAQLESANSKQLVTWGTNVLTAESLDEIFDSVSADT